MYKGFFAADRLERRNLFHLNQPRRFKSHGLSGRQGGIFKLAGGAGRGSAKTFFAMKKIDGERYAGK